MTQNRYAAAFEATEEDIEGLGSLFKGLGHWKAKERGGVPDGKVKGL